MRSKYPASVRRYYDDQAALRPYWAIEDAIWQRYQPLIKEVAGQAVLLEESNPLKARQLLARYPQVLQARRMIALAKHRMRLTRPAINKALSTWY